MELDSIVSDIIFQVSGKAFDSIPGFFLNFWGARPLEGSVEVRGGAAPELSTTPEGDIQAALAQLGERQTEDLKVVCSIHTSRISFAFSGP